MSISTGPDRTGPGAVSAFGAATMKSLPGVALVLGLTLAAWGLRSLPGIGALSPMILGILLGVVICNVLTLPKAVQPGIRFAGKGVLRFSVALLGLQVTLMQIADQGAYGVFSAAAVLFATFGLTVALGRAMGVSRELSILIGAGTSVCGAAAIAGVNGAIRARDESVTYAVAAITLFGTLAMFSYPLIGALLGLNDAAYGSFIGLSVHEVAQVVGAGFQGGDAAGQQAVIVKLTRVVLLGPLILGITLLMLRGKAGATAGRLPLLPWFVTLFLVLSALRSTGLLPEALTAPLISATPLLMTAALTALGLGTRFSDLRSLGLKPLALCACASVFIAAASLLLISL